jgi:hypothetical protein
MQAISPGSRFAQPGKAIAQKNRSDSAGVAAPGSSTTTVAAETIKRRTNLASLRARVAGSISAPTLERNTMQHFRLKFLTPCISRLCYPSLALDRARVLLQALFMAKDR